MSTASRNRTLKGRFLRLMLGILVPLGLATLASLAFIHHRSMEQTARDTERLIRDAISQKGRVLTQNHALALASLVADNAFGDVETIVRQAVAGDPDVVYGLFVANDGTPWAYVSPTTLRAQGAAHDPNAQLARWRELGLTASQLAASKPNERARHLFGMDVLEFAAPVLESGELLGSVRYGFGTARLQRELSAAHQKAERTWMSSLLAVAVLALLNIALGMLLVNRAFTNVSSPLLALTDAANKIAEGKRDARVVVQSGDELELLAKAFNQMLEANQRAFEQLEKTTEQALEAARLKSEFLANMSHEIRTPMNGVIGIAQLMLNMPLDGKLRRYVETIDASSTALLTIINDVLDFSKMEAGKYVLQQAPFEPHLVVQDVAELLVPRASEKGLELVYRIATDVPERVVGDGDRFRQVLNNLIGNAIKFTESGEVFIDVRLESLIGDDARLHVAVNDTGIGIAEKDLDSIFDAFSQVDGSLVRKQGGTGLGLAISRRLVEMMGGTLGVWSRPGMGSQFWFTLDGKQSGKSALPASALPTNRALLLIEPSHRWREVICEHVKAWGLSCEAFGSAQGALPRVREALTAGRHFDVVVVGAPVGALELRALMDTLQTANADRRVPLIMLSQPGGPSALSGLDQYLTTPLAKPLRMSDLHKGIYDALLGRLEHKPRHSVSRQPRPTHRQKVLVVDDNQVNQFVAAEQLSEAGYQVEVAEDGQQAVAMTRNYDYLVVLMDCQMPVMDGYAATRQIRADEQQTGKHQLIIALTAHAMAGERERVAAAGMDDYLTKPLRGNALARMIAYHTRSDGLAPSNNNDGQRDTPETTAVVDTRGSMRERGYDSQPAGSVAPWGSSQALDPEVPRSLMLVQTCLREMPKHLDAVISALEAADCVALRAAAHKLKGSSLAIGADTLAHSAEQLQHSAELGALDECVNITCAVQEQYAQVETALQTELVKRSACG